MVVGRTIGWLLLLLAVAAAGVEVVTAVQAGTWRALATGEVWYRLDPGSLNAAQAGVQRYVASWLWEPVITTVLLWPAWAVLGAPGLVLLWACRRRGHGRRRRRH